MGGPQSERQTEGQGGNLAQQLTAGIARLERAGGGASLSLVTSFGHIQTFIHAHFGAHLGHPSFFQEVDSGRRFPWRIDAKLLGSALFPLRVQLFVGVA